MNGRVGIIGGSGICDIPGFEVEREVNEETPFGSPSGPLILGHYEKIPVAFLPRHGIGHILTPSEVPYAANIYAMKASGVRTIISASAVGSLKLQIEPRHFVIPDQLFDRTFGDPFCERLRSILIAAARDNGSVVHPGGTMVVMEGPAFSTRAESLFYRSTDAAIIGMTALPEAKLAREAGICYAIMAMSTDYDVWHETEEDVTIETVIANVQANLENARAILGRALHMLEERDDGECGCCAGSDTIMTAVERRSPRKMEDLRVILER